MSETGKHPLTHLDEQGSARMVDVSGKPVTRREAVASAAVVMRPETLRLITEGRVPKGDVPAAARIAGIMAAKRTGELIPMCHPLPLEAVTVELTPEPPDRLRITARAAITARTGVEMEALTAAATAALTVYDMCKSADRGMVITDLRLDEKTGGRSGHYRREEAGAGQTGETGDPGGGRPPDRPTAGQETRP
jgi:cyclic pyranopterin phosphate synthase